MSKKNKNRGKVTIRPPQGNQVESTAEIVIVLTECQLQRVDWAVTELVRDQKINVDRSDVIAKCVDIIVDKVVLSFLKNKSSSKPTPPAKTSNKPKKKTEQSAAPTSIDKTPKPNAGDAANAADGDNGTPDQNSTTGSQGAA